MTRVKQDSARSSESGEEPRDISRSRRARVEQAAKTSIHQPDETLLFDAAVKFCTSDIRPVVVHASD